MIKSQQTGIFFLSVFSAAEINPCGRGERKAPCGEQLTIIHIHALHTWSKYSMGGGALCTCTFLPGYNYIYI